MLYILYIYMYIYIYIYICIVLTTEGALRANFVQLLQFHLFVQRSHFISAIAFVSRHVCF